MYLRDEFGERLRNERQRFGMTQAAFGNAVCLGRTTQKAYELAQNVPDVRYLRELERLGVGVQYPLTGERNPFALAYDENGLLTLYREIPAIIRRTALRVMKALAEEG